MFSEQLRACYKLIQPKIVSTSAQIVAGRAGTMATCGAGLVFSGIGLRRASVNSQKCKLIEARLSEKGWVSHDFEFVVSALILQFARLAAFWLACVIRARWLSYSQVRVNTDSLVLALFSVVFLSFLLFYPRDVRVTIGQ